MEDAREAQKQALEELDDQRKPFLDIHEMLNKGRDMILERDAEPIDIGRVTKNPYQYYEPHTGGMPAVICTCGWKKSHLRFKVLEQASLRHFNKTGHNTNPKGEW